jgi:CP family cyanate transporter-like MFS transporter
LALEGEVQEQETASGPAAIVVGAGVVAALNFGKLPPALPALQHDFDLSLLQASWMVSLFMFAAALFGLAGGSIADRFGPRRVMLLGLLTLAGAGAAGALADSAAVLFVTRALESFGFLLTVLPGPAMLARAVAKRALRGWLGFWSAYMPAGMGLALILTPWLMQAGGWRSAWWAAAVMAAVWAGMVALVSPPTPGSTGRTPPPAPLARRAWATATCAGPWLLALCFLFYAGQFVGIFSFLPTVYSEAGAPEALAALLTALAVIANIAGNVASGLLLQSGFERQSLISFAGCTMALTAWLAFGTDLVFALRYSAILLLSAAGGLIPGTLFASAPFYAPAPSAVSTTVGLMQQGSAVGQILLPPLIAALAQASGGWTTTWIATGMGACATVAIAEAMRRYDRRRMKLDRGQGIG